MKVKAVGVAVAAAAFTLMLGASASASYVIDGEAARMMLGRDATQTQIIGACSGDNGCIALVRECFADGGRWADVDSRPGGGGSVACYGRGVA